jgi:hypothetical protein
MMLILPSGNLRLTSLMRKTLESSFASSSFAQVKVPCTKPILTFRSCAMTDGSSESMEYLCVSSSCR